MDIKKSVESFKRSEKILVGGVNSPVRSFNSVGGNALIIKNGKGAKITDEDNNTYTDYCLSWGALIYGHAHRNVVLAAKKTVERGTSFGTTTKAEIDLGQFIVENVPSIEKIRFVNSGTEATMSAIRLARGYTNKSCVVKFDGCYHGHVDDLLTTAGSGVANLHESSSLGIPQSHIENTISLPFNDIGMLKATISERKDDIACVIVEPVAGNMGVIPASREFLTVLREITQKYNIVLIFDEIMTGFRTQLGCVQSDYHIIPDMTCLGKIIGGGFPIGAYGGKDEIMECLAPLGGVYQAGTFSGNPIVMRAGLSTLKLLNKQFYQSLNEKCEEFSQDLNTFFNEKNYGLHLSKYYSMMSLRFSTNKVDNYADAQESSSQEIYGSLFRRLLQEGIYLPPADLESFFVSGMHTKKELKELSNGIKNYFIMCNENTSKTTNEKETINA